MIRLAGASLASVAVALLAGCAFARVDHPAPDTFATWQEVPLPPDPALTAIVVGAGSPCIALDEGAPPPLQVLVQDRRTESTAAFLVASPGHFCSAIVTLAGGMAGGGIGPALEPAAGPLTIDDRSAGTAGASTVSQLGGRIGVPVGQVVVELADGRSVVASVTNGYWLTWWPGSAAAVRVVARADSGAEVASLAVDP